MDRYTTKVMTRYVKVFRNGAHVGNIAYSRDRVGWLYRDFEHGVTGEARSTWPEVFADLQKTCN